MYTAGNSISAGKSISYDLNTFVKFEPYKGPILDEADMFGAKPEQYKILGEADPELEKLLMEEELIEQQEVGTINYEENEKEINDMGSLAQTAIANVSPAKHGIKVHTKVEPRQHRTAVFLDITAVAAKDDYVERIKRFAYSFNHNETIKAHVFLVLGNRIFPYKTYKNAVKSFMHEADTKPLAAAKLEQWATAEGYSLVVFATCPSREIA
jgi:hypothetical protein